uniref:Uncharacterized protein n=1 Tax=Oryza brachyantha TaxID=4533 RepID=J3LRM2_ORYBR
MGLILILSPFWGAPTATSSAAPLHGEGVGGERQEVHALAVRVVRHGNHEDGALAKFMVMVMVTAESVRLKLVGRAVVDRWEQESYLGSDEARGTCPAGARCMSLMVIEWEEGRPVG